MKHVRVNNGYEASCYRAHRKFELTKLRRLINKPLTVEKVIMGIEASSVIVCDGTKLHLRTEVKFSQNTVKFSTLSFHIISESRSVCILISRQICPCDRNRFRFNCY